jgi:hypothetical protein
MKITGFSCAPTAEPEKAPETKKTREEQIAIMLLRRYGKKEAYEHAANMCHSGSYKKQGIDCDKVLAELNKLTGKTKK